MNLKIEGLLEKAGFTGYVPLNNEYVTYGISQGAALERFTKLIIDECVKSIRNTNLEDVDGGDSAVLNAAAEQVIKHFED